MRHNSNFGGLLRHVKLLIAVLLLAAAAQGQSFFRPLPKRQLTLGGSNVMNEIRPVANIVSYSIPDNRLLTGGGIGFMHMTWEDATQKWKTQYSVNALIWYSKSLSGEDDTNNTLAYGLSLGVLNNLIMIGIATDSKKVFATLGLGISLNN